MHVNNNFAFAPFYAHLKTFCCLDEQISAMRKELEKYGIQMPAFSKIGGILESEVGMAGPALVFEFIVFLFTLKYCKLRLYCKVTLAMVTDFSYYLSAQRFLPDGGVMWSEIKWNFSRIQKSTIILFQSGKRD